MRKNWLQNIQLFAIFGLVIFLYSFASKRNDARKIGNPTIEILDANNPFVTPEIVNKLLMGFTSKVLPLSLHHHLTTKSKIT